jgi:hypothetical protein
VGVVRGARISDRTGLSEVLMHFAIIHMIWLIVR